MRSTTVKFAFLALFIGTMAFPGESIVAAPPGGQGGGQGGAGGNDKGGGGADEPLQNPAMVFQARSGKSKSSDIFIRTADGSSEQQLTKDELMDHWPAWSPDGEHVAFLRQHAIDSPDYDLYLINADGSGLTLLKDFVADNEPIIPDGATGFDWSPDGTMIVLDGLYVLDVATGQGSYLLGAPDPGSGWQPAWSPDGTMIAFSSYVTNPLTGNTSWDIFVVDLTTFEVVNLTLRDGSDTSPVWSPDGSMIAFVLDDDDLAVMTLATGTVDVVVQEPDLSLARFGSRPTWTPDGGSIMFAAFRAQQSTAGDWDLFRVSPTGTGLINITATDRRREGHVDWNPAW